jgi:aminoglycoside phosphotransferase (APT) family kinase protein
MVARVTADLDVIRRLVGQQRVRPLAAGLDHRVYEVGVGLVARFGPGAAAEAALLAAVAPRVPLPVPVPVAVDDAAGCLVLPRAGGVPLLTLPRDARRPFAPALLEFVEAVHALDLPAPVDDTPPGAWLDEARVTWPTVRSVVPARLHRPVETFLAAAPPDPVSPCFIHGDLGAEHVFVDDDAITGVIDWGDAARGDPALDFGRLARDLGVDRGRRARFYAVCTALEDVAFGREPYVANAIAALDELRGGDDRIP